MKSETAIFFSRRFKYVNRKPDITGKPAASDKFFIVFHQNKSGIRVFDCMTELLYLSCQSCYIQQTASLIYVMLLYITYYTYKICA